MASRLNPYLTFDGKAREAMEFYRDVLGGELALTTYGEGGMSQGPDDADHVMHSQLETPSGYTLMAGDVALGTSGDPTAGAQVSISGDTDADAELSAYFDKLAADGTVIEPLVTAPWGDKFGMLKDRFGITWMVNIAGNQQG